MVLAILALGAFPLIASANSDVFTQPKQTCSALRSDGLSTDGWQPSRASPGKWFCMTTLVPFGPPGATGMQNNIAFYVNGSSVNRADDIRIKININNATERQKAFARLTTATDALFKSIQQPVPQEVRQALLQQRAAVVKTSYGQVELVREPGKIESFKLVLTDSKATAAKEQVTQSSADEFRSCMSVVSKAAGYAASFISGDGASVQEAGYRSFMMTGRGKDLFFCEVYPGGRYRVKAALNGSFPFKYIAEGTF